MHHQLVLGKSTRIKHMVSKQENMTKPDETEIKVALLPTLSIQRPRGGPSPIEIR